MSRSGYTDDGDNAAMWMGAVRSAIRGKRGQAFLREMALALDAMLEKRLIRESLVDEDGEVCAIGAVGQRRGLDMGGIELDDYGESVAGAFGIARALACEIAYENDEYWREETPEERWTRMRAWVENQIGEGGK